MVVIMTFQAMPIEDRLDVAREIEQVGCVSNRLDFVGAFAECGELVGEMRGRLGTMFVAADATNYFARLRRGETLHSFDSEFVLVQRDEKDAAHGWDFQVSGAVFLDRHGAEDVFEGESAAVADGFHTAGEMNRHGQTFQYEQLLDFARFDPVHISALVNIGQNHSPARLRQIEVRRNNRFARTSQQGTRFMAFQTGSQVF